MQMHDEDSKQLTMKKLPVHNNNTMNSNNNRQLTHHLTKPSLTTLATQEEADTTLNNVTAH